MESGNEDAGAIGADVPKSDVPRSIVAKASKVCTFLLIRDYVVLNQTGFTPCRCFGKRPEEADGTIHCDESTREKVLTLPKQIYVVLMGVVATVTIE